MRPVGEGRTVTGHQNKGGSEIWGGVVAIVTMRASDTYVTAMLFRVVASRAPPSKRERASLSFGQLLVLTTLLASLLAVVLVHGRAIHCQMPPPPPSVSTVLPPNCE